MISQQQWADLVKQVEREAQIANELLEAQPELGITALVIAGDQLSAERATALVANGLHPERAVLRVGSYARFDWAVRHLPQEVLFQMLPELWSGSDPDDTNPEYLKLWRSAWLRNGRKPICDGAALPQAKPLMIYRGQARNAEIGFAWTLDRNTAAKFAESGGLRGRITNGVILNSNVDRQHIYGYLTGRGEQEIIVDPKRLQYRIGVNQ